jgi:predicted transcriptional regulator
VISNYDLADPRRRMPDGTTLVRDVMTRLVYGVRAGDSVLAAVRLMIDEKIRRVVAVNDDGSIAGVIVPMDILRVLARKEVGRLEYVDLRALAVD